jgi:hypothetical protein
MVGDIIPERWAISIGISSKRSCIVGRLRLIEEMNKLFTTQTNPRFWHVLQAQLVRDSSLSPIGVRVVPVDRLRKAQELNDDD